jgi:hypothetical protein
MKTYLISLSVKKNLMAISVIIFFARPLIAKRVEAPGDWNA